MAVAEDGFALSPRYVNTSASACMAVGAPTTTGTPDHQNICKQKRYFIGQFLHETLRQNHITLKHNNILAVARAVTKVVVSATVCVVGAPPAPVSADNQSIKPAELVSPTDVLDKSSVACYTQKRRTFSDSLSSRNILRDIKEYFKYLSRRQTH